ncbi:fam-a protein [Plasmodium yoelii yoelii]|uniref:Fam-a protein n=1 Tax=Plasmodium yoelii yoelii TaxID=73239 RepID=A0AAE9WU93_PLAYO|nr:fam-a protein [Plasmodium yoelii yoelii]
MYTRIITIGSKLLNNNAFIFHENIVLFNGRFKKKIGKQMYKILGSNGILKYLLYTCTYYFYDIHQTN